MTDPDTARYQVDDPISPYMGSGEVTVYSEDDCLVLQIHNTFDGTSSHVDLHDPEQIRRITARLITECLALQDRLDIQEGTGGDQ